MCMVSRSSAMVKASQGCMAYDRRDVAGSVMAKSSSSATSRETVACVKDQA